MLTMPPRAQAVFGAEAIVDDAEFADGFLRRSGALRTRGGVDVVGAVHGDFVAEVAQPGEGDAGDFKFRDGGLQAGAASGYARGEQGEIGEEAAADGERIDLLGINDLADFGASGLNDRGFTGDDDFLALGGDLRVTSTVALWPTVRVKPVCVSSRSRRKRPSVRKGPGRDWAGRKSRSHLWRWCKPDSYRSIAERDGSPGHTPPLGSWTVPLS